MSLGQIIDSVLDGGIFISYSFPDTQMHHLAYHSVTAKLINS